MTTDTTCIHCGRHLHPREHTMGWVCDRCQERDDEPTDYEGLLVALAAVCLVLGLLFARLLH